MDPKNVQLTIKNDRNFVRVLLPDAVGVIENQEIEKEILRQYGNDKKPLVMDFSDTTMIYSSGLGLLIRLRKIMSERECQIYFVNVSKKIREMFTVLNLDRIFPIYSTDAEFDVSVDTVWHQKVSEGSARFLFIHQVENGEYRLTLTGQMSSLQDLSSMAEFKPVDGITHFIFNLENLDLIDTYGAQLFSDFIERIHHRGGMCIFYGANSMIRELFGLFPAIPSASFFQDEKQAIASLHK